MTHRNQHNCHDSRETVRPSDEQESTNLHQYEYLTIIFHPDLSRIGQQAMLFSQRCATALSRLTPNFCAPDNNNYRPIDCINVSRRPTWITPLGEGGVLISPDPQGSIVCIDGIQAFGKRIISSTEIARGVVIELAQRVVLLLHYSTREPQEVMDNLGIVGQNNAICRLRKQIRKIAPLEQPFLIQGETGTGKELVARAIHRVGPRRTKPFVTVNLAAVSPQIAVSALFGHVRGAFTGADRVHFGYFEQADGGVLFLDEVGDASPEVQEMLLRAVEYQEIQSIGAQGTKTVNVHVVAATDKDLFETSSNDFSTALYYRLAGKVLYLPPLRDRLDDIGRLLLHFLREERTKMNVLYRLDCLADGTTQWLPAKLIAQMARYDWPGNVRQLRSIALQLAHLESATEAKDVFAEVSNILRVDDHKAKADASQCREDDSRPREFTNEKVFAVMKTHHYNIVATASALGISRTTLYGLIEKHPYLNIASKIPIEDILRCLDECDGVVATAAERLYISKRALQMRLRQIHQSPSQKYGPSPVL